MAKVVEGDSRMTIPALAQGNQSGTAAYKIIEFRGNRK